jgi:hypothetical protein
LLRLADEMEGMYHPISTRFEAMFALHTGVLPGAAGDGIDAPRWDLREGRIGAHALERVW